MPVSKKRKKGGKPVSMSHPVATAPEHEHGPDAKPAAAPSVRVGRPSNPFVAQQQGRRGAQRGR
jgi:hypothetical protein